MNLAENAEVRRPEALRSSGRLGEPASDERLIESSRVEAFSDGVLAIVITLLVLDLHAPNTRGDLGRALLRQWPEYAAYLASFSYVGVVWINHHQLFTRIAKVDRGLLWSNLALLLTTSILPFPTAVLATAFEHGDHADQTAAVIVDSAVSATVAGSWLLLFHHLSQRPSLLHEHVHATFFRQERRRALAGVSGYGVAAAIAPVAPAVALAVLGVLPIFYALTSDGLGARPAATFVRPARARRERDRDVD